MIAFNYCEDICQTIAMNPGPKVLKHDPVCDLLHFPIQSRCGDQVLC